MADKIVTVDVLRRMVQERLEALHRGEISTDFLRGYLIAMFHAGAISLDECSDYLGGNAETFTLKPPET